MHDPATIEACAAGLVARLDREDRQSRARADALRERALEAARRIGHELGATRVWLFGSIAWGRVHDESDVDLLVEGLESHRWSEAVAIAESATALPVDLVRVEEAPPGLVERVESEGVLLHDGR